MKINKKYLGPAGFTLFFVAAIAMTAHKAWSERQQKTELIVNFYKDHLNRPEKPQANQLPPGAFYSRELEALVDANSQLCDSLSRGDDICGYGADGDVFLQTQEVPPGLDFEQSQFEATRSGENTVDVTFNLYPDMGSSSARRLQYVLVRENEGWRVSDILFGEKDSMRQELKRESDAILARARDLSDAAGWVYNYLGSEDMMDRAVRFIAFPVQVCDHYGLCVAMKRDDPRLMQALDAVGHNMSDAAFLPKPGEVQATDGKVVTVNALDFTFQHKAWWVTKIDLRRTALTPGHE